MVSFSIITATYNAAAHLRHCFASVAAQTVPCEHIIVDGGSNDGTLVIIEKYAKQIRPIESGASFCPVTARYVTENDNGIYDALNKGIALATGDIIGILHADDFYPSSEILSRVVSAFAESEIDACYGDLLYVKEVKPEQFKTVRYWHSGPYSSERFKWGWMPPHPTFFVRRSVYEQFGRFNLEMGTAADYELMLRFMLKYDISCRYIPDILVHMRTGGVSNRSFRNRILANRYDKKAWDVNSLKPYPWTLALKPFRKIPQWFCRP